MKLISVSDCKTLFGVTGSGDDTLLGLLIDKVSRRIESHCKRTFTRGASDVTEYLTGGSKVLEPMRFPISVVTSITESDDRDFSSATALDSTQYYSDGRFIYRVDGEIWNKSVASVQLIYNGGYVETTGVLTSVDDAIQEAALLQVGFLYQRRLKLGFSSVSGGDGSVQTLTEVDLLPEVRKALMPFRRNVLNV